jgi:uncharacterized membrane protein YkvA (DUF1232 family)
MPAPIMDDAKLVEILEPGSERENERREADVRARFWRTAKRAARQVPFMEDVVAGYYVALDRKTPLRVRGTLLAALAYFVMPADMIPDFIVGFGFTDDAAVRRPTARPPAPRWTTPTHRTQGRACRRRVDAATHIAHPCRGGPHP